MSKKSQIGLTSTQAREGRAEWLPDRSHLKVNSIAAYEAGLAKVNETDEASPSMGDYDDLEDIEMKF